jgi:hypothetical protein
MIQFGKISAFSFCGSEIFLSLWSDSRIKTEWHDLRNLWRGDIYIYIYNSVEGNERKGRHMIILSVNTIIVISLRLLHVSVRQWTRKINNSSIQLSNYQFQSDFTTFSRHSKMCEKLRWKERVEGTLSILDCLIHWLFSFQIIFRQTHGPRVVSTVGTEFSTGPLPLSRSEWLQPVTMN